MVMGKQNKVWDDEVRVRAAFASARSLKDILVCLDEPLGSANYMAVKLAAGRYNLDLPIFDRRSLLTTLGKARTIPLEEILVEYSDYSNRQNLKNRLIKEGLLRDECYSCGLKGTWNGAPITLQLEHINGVGYDNRIENLSVLCPNCHSQTSTFGNRNPQRYVNGVNGYCACGKKSKAGRCVKCAGEDRRGRRVALKQKIDWPPLEELEALVLEHGYRGTGRLLHVSDTSVGKRIRTEREIVSRGQTFQVQRELDRQD